MLESFIEGQRGKSWRALYSDINGAGAESAIYDGERDNVLYRSDDDDDMGSSQVPRRCQETCAPWTCILFIYWQTDHADIPT